MKYKLATAAVLGTLLLGGCGGSDDIVNAIKDEIKDNIKEQIPTGTVDWGSKETVNNITLTTLGMFQTFGPVDSLVWAVDEAKENRKCVSGDYQKSGDSITFNNCKGLLEADPNAIISGSVKVKAGSNQNSNSYNYDKFTVLDGDGDKTTVTGYLNVSNNSNDTEGSVATDYLKITFTEKVNNQVKDYEYGLVSYQSNWKDLGNDAFSLNSNGKYYAKGEKIGDYAVKFQTVKPFIFESEDANPTDGLLKFEDLANSRNSVTLSANSDGKTVMYQSLNNGQQFINETITWDDIWDF